MRAMQIIDWGKPLVLRSTRTSLPPLMVALEKAFR